MTYEETTEKCMKHEHFLVKVNEDIQWCAFCGSIKIKDRVKVPDTYIKLHTLRSSGKYEDCR